MCVPYLVELDNGQRAFAPVDDDSAIRKSSLNWDVNPVEVSDDAASTPPPAKTMMSAGSMKSREGCAVELVGLRSQATLNGRRARTLQWNDEKQRMGVQLDDGGTCVAVKMDNLRFVDGDVVEVTDAAAFEPVSTFLGPRPGFVFKHGSRGLGYYQDDRADVGEQMAKLVAGASEEATPTPITTRQGATARVNADETLPDVSSATPLLADRAQIERSFRAYRALAEKLPAHVMEGTSSASFDLEVLLLLLGIKPSVLICHATNADYVQRMVTDVFKPWIAGASGLAPPELQYSLVLRQVTHQCTPVGAMCFQGAWVLCAASHPQRCYVEAAFFPPATLRFVPRRDPVLYALIGRALGYPSACVGDLNCDLAYVLLSSSEAEATDPPLAHMVEVADDRLLLDFRVEAPEEIPGALRHFAGCKRACAGILEIGLAMGGRHIRAEALEALEGKPDKEVIEAFDGFADQINTLNSDEVVDEERSGGVHV